MSDVRKAVEEQAAVDRTERGPEAAPGARPEAGAGPAAHRAGAPSPGQPGAPGGAPDGAHASDEDALRGDVDELVAVAAQRDEYLALAQRTQADFENYRKRVAREAAEAQERGVTKLAGELLPALDNLDRALAAAAENDPLLDGVRLVRSELSAALARAGVESFSPLGERFDPALHEAMATAEQPAEGAESGTIVEVYQPG